MTKIDMNKVHMVPIDNIEGYDVRPGMYEINGATAIPGGVNFTIHSNHATSCELLLFHRKATEPFVVMKFPEQYRIGNVYSMIVFGLNIEDFEYAYRMDGPYDFKKGLIFDRTKYLLDPYAKAVTGQSVWGNPVGTHNVYKARVVKNDFDWDGFVEPYIPMEDLIIYELHVRGFTKDASSGLCETDRGTFEGLRKKIPYLKELGVNAVELMPIFEFDETRDRREVNGEILLDYWGYNPVSFFAPNTSYTSRQEYNREGNELKRLIKELNENRIEVFLDVVFNHTAEGNEKGPYISFKGIDNNIYYMLTPDGYYYNFSGCGNTLNCNHPIVQQMIIECLRYWVINYRIDGFRFDLATILGRNEDGSPMNKPPLLQSLAFDPILGKVKLIAEAWDAGGLYQVGSFPSWNRWSEWNGRYRDEIRGFLKGDSGLAYLASSRITGSTDLYDEVYRGSNASVNFITCHDGFTLYDLYAYNYKHNEANGWNNTDGTNDNFSWNCGEEGETDNPEVNKLRRRMVKNACTVLMMSRGIPMFFAGDEFMNTSFGNNNAYCQDNITSWLDWNLLEKNRDMFEFFKRVIGFRKKNSVIRRNGKFCSLGFPPVSTHGILPFENKFDNETRFIGVMFAGRKENETAEDEIIYMAINTYWEAVTFTLPDVSAKYGWMKVIDTMNEESWLEDKKLFIKGNECIIGERTVMVFKAAKYKISRGRKKKAEEIE